VIQTPLELTRFAMFSGLSQADAQILAEQCIPVRYPAGHRIFDEGEPGKGFYLVQSGQVKVFKVSPRGQEHILLVAGPGQSFAEAAVLVGRGYPASSECLEDSELILVEREPIRQLLARDPDFALRMMAGMALKLRQLVGMVEDLTLRDAKGRVCRYLLNLAADDSASQCAVKLPTQQTVLARLLGLTQETLSRTLKGLREEGLIESGGQDRRLVLQVALLRQVVDETH